MKILEKDIQNVILEWLQYQPQTFVWRQNAGSAFMDGPTGRHGFRSASVPGISDIMGIWKGRPIAIEVKRPGKKPTENQQNFLNEFYDSGGIAIVATSLEQVQNILKQIENGALPPTIEGQLKAWETNEPLVAEKKGDRQ